MPAFGNVVINNGAASPVAKTFEPVNIDQNDVSHLAESSGGIPIGYGRLSFSLREPVGGIKAGSNSSSGVYKCLMKLEIPTLEVTSPSTGSGLQPAPTVAFVTMAKLEFMIPARATEAERKDILAYAKNLLAHSISTDLVVGLKNIY